MHVRERKLVIAALCAAVTVVAPVIWTSDASGQTPQWNRQVKAIAVVPATGGSYDLHIVWKASVEEPNSVPLDLSTQIDVFRNTTLITTLEETVGIDPGSGTDCLDGPICDASCGFGTIDGVPATLICQRDGPNECCCSFLPRASSVPSVVLLPHDEIMVILRPAPGALPDPDQSDDQLRVVLGEEPISWDRRLQSIEVVPSPIGPPGTFDVTVQGSVLFDGLGPFVDAAGLIDLGLVYELRVNQTPMSSAESEFLVEWAGDCGDPGTCGESCAILGTIPLTCAVLGSYCDCSFLLNFTFPSVPAATGDEIMVILRPAPGALPEVLPEGDQIATVIQTEGIGTPSGAPASLSRLAQSVPNPFNPSASIQFSTENAGPVRLEIYDLQGRLVRTLIAGEMFAAGEWSATWDGMSDAGEPATSGVYIYRLTADGVSESRKMTLVR